MESSFQTHISLSPSPSLSHPLALFSFSLLLLVPVHAQYIKCFPCENGYFRYNCVKVILSSWGRLRQSKPRVKRPYEDKITFSLVYRTQFFTRRVGSLILGMLFYSSVRESELRTRSVKTILGVVVTAFPSKSEVSTHLTISFWLAGRRAQPSDVWVEKRSARNASCSLTC